MRPEPKNLTRPMLRAITEYARFKLISAAHEFGGENPGAKRYQVHAPVYVALHTLGYEGDELAKMLGPNPLAFARERLRVDFGDHATTVFDLWFNYQALLSLLNNLTRPETSEAAMADLDYVATRALVVDPLRTSIASLGGETSLTEVLDAVDGCLGEDTPTTKDIAVVRDLLADHFGDVSRRMLGLDETVTGGRVAHLGVSYATAYRMAHLAGAARAEALFAAVGARNDAADPNTKRYALRAAIEVLGVERTVPARRLRKVRKAFARLRDVQGRLRKRDWSRIWDWLHSFLAVSVGGQSEHVYLLSYHLDMLSLALSFENGEPIALEALADIGEPLGRVGALDLERRACALVDQIQGDPHRLAALSGECSTLVGDVRQWLAETIFDDDGAPVDATVTVFAHRFRSYWVPIDEQRVAAFLAQFPPSLRWIGEGLTEAVQFFDEAYFSRSLSYLLRLVPEQGSLCLLGGARKSASVMSYLLERDLPHRYEELRAVAARSGNEPIVFVDDCLVSGTQAEHIVAELFGTWRGGQHRYHDALTTAERGRLRARPMKFIFGVATDAGGARFAKFLKGMGLDYEILVGHEVPLLSADGRSALDGDVLLDDGSSVLNPVANLATPLFSPFERVWTRGESWTEARDFCQRVGYALLERRARAKNWSEERRRGSALGFSGFQGRLVFAHNVPKTTLTLLWETGAFEGRAWFPLFPSRD